MLIQGHDDMFQITANPAAKDAFDTAHEIRGAALRQAVQTLFRPRETQSTAAACAAE